MENKKEKGIRVNLYLQEELYNDYKKVKTHLREQGSSLSQVFQEYIIAKSKEIK